MSIKNIIGLAVFGLFMAFIGLPAVFGSWYTVDQGSRVVVTRNGQVISEAGPGLHWKTPYIDSVHSFDVKTDKLVYEKITGHTSDQQQITDMSASVNYHIDPAQVESLYGQLGDKYVDVKLAPVFLSSVTTELGKVTAQQLINNMDTVAQAIASRMQAQLAPYHIVVETVQITRPVFNAAFEANINALIQQEVAVRTQQQALEREKIDADIAITKAHGASESAKQAADGEAYATKVKATAEAEAIRIKGNALVSNPLIVELTKAQAWDGKLPQYNMGGVIPMINLSK